MKVTVRNLSLILLPIIFLSCKKVHLIEQTLENVPVSGITDFFSSIPFRESPYPDFIGIVRITEQMANKRNHYRFEYDNQGQLREVSFRNGETIIYPNHTANIFFLTPIIRFDYEESNEVRTFYDRNNNQVTSKGVFKEIFELDNRGRRTSLYFEDDNGNNIENDWGIAKYTWQHQLDGSIIENRYDLKGNEKELRPEFEFYRIKLTYEQNGVISLMQYIDDEGNLVENDSGAAQDKIEFDAKGRWYGWNVLNKDGNLEKGNAPNVARGIDKPNRWGYETGTHYKDEDGNRINSSYGFGGGRRTYDEFGNYLEQKFIDINDNPAPREAFGYTYAKYTYGIDGIDQLKIELLDLDKNPIAFKRGGFAFVTKEYDDNHNIIKKSYLNTKGELMNRTNDGIAYTEYIYDSNMKQTGMVNYDNEGKEIKN